MNIRKEPSELTAFFDDNLFRLKYDEYVVAENDVGVTVALCSSSDYDPILMVEKDGRMILCYAIDRTKLQETAEFLYQEYIYEKPEEEPEPEKTQEEEAQDEEDMLYEREDALMNAFRDFMEVVLTGDDMIDEKECAEALDAVLQTVSECGYNVYRPMYVTDDSGVESLVEFPYEYEN